MEAKVLDSIRDLQNGKRGEKLFNINPDLNDKKALDFVCNQCIKNLNDNCQLP